MQGNTGSFMSAVPGGADPVKEAMQRRGMVPATAQSSMSNTPMPQSPTGSPGMPVPMGGQPQPSGGIPGSPQPINAMGNVGGNNDEIIINALSKKLQSNAKILETQSGVIR